MRTPYLGVNNPSSPSLGCNHGWPLCWLNRVVMTVKPADTKSQMRSRAALRLRRNKRKMATYPSVVMVTIVYQKAAGMEVKLVPSTFFSA